MQDSTYTQKIREAIDTLRRAKIDARYGLPEELFLLVSTLSPIPNVDLLITDEYDRLLLSRRNDPHFGEGWHIPGGCIRFGETMEQRIQATAHKELGCEVTYDPKPITVCDVFRDPRQELDFPEERSHHLAILFNCKLPMGYIINNKNLSEKDPGYLRWFSTLPQDMLQVHNVYHKYLEPWLRRKDNDGLEK